MIVWPLQMILFQLLFLLVAIALEARVLQRRLRITRKASIEYATSINLLTVIIGWLVFFILMDRRNNLLPPPIQDQIVSFIFFDRLLSPQPGNLYLILVATGVVIFFCAFIIKLKGLQLLEALRETSTAKRPLLQTEPSSRFALPARLEQALIRTDTNQATAVLLANAYSHSAIFLLLFLRFIQINPLNQTTL